MSGNFTRTSLGDFPRIFATKSQQTLRLQILKENQHQALIEAYLGLQQFNSPRELPPVENEACRAWVVDMIGRGINLLAVCSLNGIVGHISLLPVDDRRCEAVVTVWPEFQNVGIGAELVRGCVQMACSLGFENMSLPLAASDPRARHIAAHCGFKTSKRWSRERKMVCDLRRQRAERDQVRIQAEDRVIPFSHLNLGFEAASMSEQAMS